jgi:hypothetical protein
MALHWYIKKKVTDFKGFYIFLIAKRAEKDDFSQKSDEDGLGLAGMAPGPNTSKAHPQHKIYPYLLRGVDIIRPNQVWSTDITYGAPNLWRCYG